ncbi:MAG: O-antigen polysaccharide polymerase Wzy family protein [Bowdeniella nasicola]|nr:O-antigen polysaccharide polymerase Wzy family protein [Bowdeniella nasicola]
MSTPPPAPPPEGAAKARQRRRRLATAQRRHLAARSHRAAHSARKGQASRVSRWLERSFFTLGALAALYGIGAWLLVAPGHVLPATFTFFGLTAAYLLWHLWRYSLLFFYLVAFFTFLYGRVAVVTATGYRAEDAVGLFGTYARDLAVVNRTLGMYHLSLVLTVSTAIALTRVLPRRLSGTPAHHALRRMAAPLATFTRPAWFMTPGTRRVFLLCFYAALIPYLVYLAMVGWFVATEGYYAFQQNRSNAAPEALRMFNDVMLVSYLLYLATFPRLRSLLTPTAVFVAARAASLVTMERNTAVLPMIAVLVYLLARVPLSKLWGWSRRATVLIVIGLTVAGSIALAAFSHINASRGTHGVASRGLDGILEFFYGQGTTINISVLYQRYSFETPPGRIYSLGPALEFIKLRLSPLVGYGDQYAYLGSHNTKHAELGHSFAHWFSYQHMNEDYIQGASWGSSAPMELWVDFGLTGVILGALAYGVLIALLQHWISHPGLMVFVALMAVRGVVFSPRASFTEFLLPFNVRALAAIILIFAVRWILAHTPWWGRLNSEEPATT